jgi:hypothetical protein
MHCKDGFLPQPGNKEWTEVIQFAVNIFALAIQYLHHKSSFSFNADINLVAKLIHSTDSVPQCTN